MKAELIKTTQKGTNVFAIENDFGMRVELLSYGAIISKLLVKTRNGEFVDVVAGYDDEDDFRNDTCYFNAFIGRVCNRIEGGKFVLEGKEYELFKNDGNNHLHGGQFGFDKKEYNAEIVGASSVKFSRVSKNLEEGYPGNLFVSVTYTLTNDNALEIVYNATSDKTTLCSLTNHAYFNLDGDFKSVLDHELFINSTRLTDVDSELIPHGKILAVKDTPYDFSAPKKIGKDIKTDDRLLKTARGYDFNYILDGNKDDLKASAYSDKSGVRLDVFTDRPCLQLYTGNFLDGVEGKKTYGYQSAFCLETQGYPNAINVPEFDSVVLKAGQEYHTKTKYVFSVK